MSFTWAVRKRPGTFSGYHQTPIQLSPDYAPMKGVRAFTVTSLAFSPARAIWRARGAQEALSGIVPMAQSQLLRSLALPLDTALTKCILSEGRNLVGDTRDI